MFKTKKDLRDVIKRYAECYCLCFDENEYGCTLSKGDYNDRFYSDFTRDWDTLLYIRRNIYARFKIIADAPTCNVTWREGILLNINYAKNSSIIL